jgi:hypothetical protein
VKKIPCPYFAFAAVRSGLDGRNRNKIKFAREALLVLRKLKRPPFLSNKVTVIQLLSNVFSFLTKIHCFWPCELDSIRDTIEAYK